MELKKLALAIAISTALTACGGGGSSSSSSSSSSSTASTYTISGTAAKGIIQKGIVTTKEYVGGTWTTVGSTLTDDNGDYTLSLSGYAGGVLKIEITAGANTTMKCDGSSGCGDAAFGQSVALPQNFTMAAVLPTVSTTTLANVPVTPYTNMAAAIVETNLASSTDKKAAVTDALAKVTNLVGFDVANTPAIDITASDISGESATAQRAATMAAALMSFTSDSKSIADVIQDLADSIKDGTLDSNDEITPTALEQSWVDIADSDTYKTILPSTTIDSVKQQASVIEQSISDDGSLTVAANPLYSATDIAKAKALITNTRSLIYNIANTDFDTPLNAIDANAAQAAEVFDKDSAAMASLLGTALEDMLSKLTEDQVTAGGTFPVDVYSGADKLGTLTLTTTSTSSGMSAKLAGTLIGTESGAKTVTVNDLTISSNLTLDEIKAASTAGTSYTLNISGGLSDGSTSLSITNGQALATLSSALSNASGDTLTAALTGIELKNLDLTLTANGATFSGNAKFSLVKPDAAKISKALYDSFPLTLKTVSLSGDFSTSDSQNIKAAVALDLGNSETFDLMAFLNNENIVWIEKDNAIDTATLAALKNLDGIPETASEWSINYSASLQSYYYQAGYYWNSGSPDYTYHGDSQSTQEAYNAQAAIYDPIAALNAVIASDYASITGSKVVYTDINVGEGYYWDENNQKVPSTYNNLHGEIQLGSYDESASTFLKVKASASFELNNVTGLPHAKVSAIVDRNSFTGGSATLAFTWDNNYYTINLDNVDVEKQTGSITVTDPLGTALTLTNVSIQDKTGSGSLYVGTNKVATIKTLTSGAVKITYTDGTFETLQ